MVHLVFSNGRGHGDHLDWDCTALEHVWCAFLDESAGGLVLAGLRLRRIGHFGASVSHLYLG